MRILDSFLDDCLIRGLSPKTISLYKSKLTVFIGVTPQIGDWPSCASWLYATYANPRTRHQVYRIVRTYIRWKYLNDLIPDDWASGHHLPCPSAVQTPILEQSDFDKLIAVIPRTKVGRRDRAFFMALYYTGARRDAFRLITWDKIDLPRRMACVVTKGGKEQCLPLPKAAAQEINAWRLHCPSSVWAFPSIRHPEHPVDDHNMSRRIARYGRKAGLGCAYLHLLRHSFGTRLAAFSGDVALVQQAMGHASIQTTMGYLRRAKTQAVKEAVDQLFK